MYDAIPRAVDDPVQTEFHESKKFRPHRRHLNLDASCELPAHGKAVQYSTLRQEMLKAFPMNVGIVVTGSRVADGDWAGKGIGASTDRLPTHTRRWLKKVRETPNLSR